MPYFIGCFPVERMVECGAVLNHFQTIDCPFLLIVKGGIDDNLG